MTSGFVVRNLAGGGRFKTRPGRIDLGSDFLGGHEPSKCRLADLELSGAPGLLTREADRARPTRLLERLVSRRAHYWMAFLDPATVKYAKERIVVAPESTNNPNQRRK